MNAEEEFEKWAHGKDYDCFEMDTARDTFTAALAIGRKAAMEEAAEIANNQDVTRYIYPTIHPTPDAAKVALHLKQTIYVAIRQQIEAMPLPL